MRRLVLVVVLALAALPAMGGTDDRPADKIEKARAAVLTDEYQQELPGADGEGSADGRVHRGERPIDFRDDRRRVDSREYERDQDTGPLGSIVTIVMWGALIVFIALLLFWLGSELLKYGGDDTMLADEKKQDEAGIDMAVIERPLGDAEELAKRGEYREAIHTLLLRTLQELVRSASVRVAPAMTSREILGRVPLLADARDALHALIITVELTHFGGDDATLDDYVRCRAQFQKFAAAFRASSARASEHAVPGAA